MRVWHGALGAGAVVALVLGLVVAADAQEGDKQGKASLPNLRPNADWQDMPTKPHKAVHGQAWADLAAGCHLAVFSTPLPDTAGEEKISESMAAILARSDYQLTPLKEKKGFFDLSGFDVTGVVALDLSKGSSATMVACYWNDREPTYCRAQCNQALAKVTP